ncbi:MAG: GNAT family N-acetyltransferase [Promethearchaeota archaeon]
MEIKKVSLRDLKQIMLLEQDIFKVNAFSKNLMLNLIHNGFIFFKLEKRRLIKQIIGIIIVIKDQKDTANIINFLIKPKFQNKGFGTYLLQRTIEEIKKLTEIRRIILNVQLSNSNAINLYEKFNFKRNPQILENYYHSGESAFLMELKLDSL